MDDGGSPLIGLIVFLVLVVINGGLYGFLTAMEEVTESQVKKRAEEGSRQALWLLKVMDSPYKVRHAIQIMMTFVSGVLGVYQIRLLGNILIHNFLKDERDFSLQVLCFFAAALAGGRKAAGL